MNGTLLSLYLFKTLYARKKIAKQAIKEMQRLQELLIADITESSLVTEDALRDYIPAEEAISLKLASQNRSTTRCSCSSINGTLAFFE